MFNKYPYTDFHEMNLDWILKTVRQIKEEWADWQIASQVKFADPIEWSPTRYYPRYTIVLDPESYDTYLAKQDVPAGIPLSIGDYWYKIGLYNAQLNKYVKHFDTVNDMINASNINPGEDILVDGHTSENDGYPALYHVSAEEPLFTEYEILNDGKYAQKIALPMTGKKVNNTAAAKQWLIECAASWLDHKDEIRYEGAGNLFFDHTFQIEGKWPLTCSLFCMAMLFGIDFEHSKYNNLAANEPNPNAYKDDELLERLADPEGFWTKNILPYFMTKGYVFKPATDLSDVEMGDMLCLRLGIEADPTGYMGVDHSVIFARHNNNATYTCWEMGSDADPHESTYNYSYANSNVLFAIRVPFNSGQAQAPVDNLLYESTSDTTQVNQIQNGLSKPLEAGKWYTFIAKVTNITEFYTFPALYDTSGYTHQLARYNSQYTKRPYNDIYIMPFRCPVNAASYVYPSLIKRSSSDPNGVGDFEWVEVIEGYHDNYDIFSGYAYNADARFLSINNKLANIDDFTDQVTTTHTKAGTFGAVKYLRICCISFHLTLTSAVSAYGVIATLPDHYRPLYQVTFGDVDITASGNIRSVEAKPSGTAFDVTLIYVSQA